MVIHKSVHNLAAHMLEVFRHKEIPVAAGQQMPLLFRHRPSGVPQAAILDPFTPNSTFSTFTAPELIIHDWLWHTTEILPFSASAHLTNIATALMIEPRLFLAIQQYHNDWRDKWVPFARMEYAKRCASGENCSGIWHPNNTAGMEYYHAMPAS